VRILQVMEATLGGTRRYLDDVVEALGPGHNFGLVYSLHRADSGFMRLLEKVRHAGWSLFELDMRRRINLPFDLKCAYMLQNIYRAFRPDVVHAHSSKAGAIARIATIGDRHRPRIVYSPHAIAVNLSWRYGAAEKLLASRLDALAAVSDSEREELCGLNLIPRERVHVVLPSIRSDVLVPEDREQARHRLKLQAGPIVVAIGRLAPQKDPIGFLTFVSALHKRVPNLRAIWVGDGQLRDAVEERIDVLGLQSVISITGWLDDVRGYLAACDLFVSTSAYEGFSTVIAEALAMGRPVVASRIPGTVDIVTIEPAAQLYAPGDFEAASVLAARLLSDPVLAARLAERGQELVLATFSREETRRGLERAYAAASQR
jgi:glycosyltransferase involved in cell wall biosynthesis